MFSRRKNNLTSMHGPGSKEGKKKIQNFLQPTLVKETTK